MPRRRAETEDDYDNGYYAQEQGSIVQLNEKAAKVPPKAFPIGFDITVKPKKETSHALPLHRQALPDTNDMPPRKPVRGRR